MKAEMLEYSMAYWWAVWMDLSKAVHLVVVMAAVLVVLMDSL
jgi:hypothetical protein